jgi:hypothetical protein
MPPKRPARKVIVKPEPKLRLHKGRRYALHYLANEALVFPAMDRQLTTLYKPAAALAEKLIKAQYPPADMKVLARHGTAAPKAGWHFLRVRDGVTRYAESMLFVLPWDDNRLAPLLHNHPSGDRAKGHGMRVGTPIVRVDAAKVSDARFAPIVQYDDMKDALQSRKGTTQRALTTVINGARTLEDVAALWPDALRYRAELQGVSPRLGTGRWSGGMPTPIAGLDMDDVVLG